jgi:hypothetical protein
MGRLFVWHHMHHRIDRSMNSVVVHRSITICRAWIDWIDWNENQCIALLCGGRSTASHDESKRNDCGPVRCCCFGGAAERGDSSSSSVARKSSLSESTTRNSRERANSGPRTGGKKREKSNHTHTHTRQAPNPRIGVVRGRVDLDVVQVVPTAWRGFFCCWTEESIKVSSRSSLLLSLALLAGS